jgi:hypothetical protein
LDAARKITPRINVFAAPDLNPIRTSRRAATLRINSSVRKEFTRMITLKRIFFL